MGDECLLCGPKKQTSANKTKILGETLVTRKILQAFLLAAATTSAMSTAANAQDYPNRPIRVFTTTSAGGLSDIFMRAIGEELGKRMGTTFVVENRPGGMQNVGTRACAESPADGYTLCIINADPLVYNQWLLKSMPFNPETALDPIVNLYHLIHMMVVNASLNVKTVDELVELSKAKPGTLSYVTPGAPMVLYMETLRKQRGADWVRVPFRGGGDAVNAIMSGSTPIGLFGEGNVVGQIRAGAMTPLVMMNNVRSPNFPKVPLLSETGYQGAPSRGWYGLFAPAGTPRPIIARVNKEVRTIVSRPEFTAKYLTARSLVPALNTPEQFAADIKRDRAQAKQVVFDAGLTPQ
jgi:tripartite-type tricarboxylate transporter receptor subunit TctC